jgi:hypothetical protein
VKARQENGGRPRLKRKKGRGWGRDGSVNTVNSIGLLLLLQFFFYQKYPFVIRSYFSYALTPISQNFFAILQIYVACFLNFFHYEILLNKPGLSFGWKRMLKGLACCDSLTLGWEM